MAITTLTTDSTPEALEAWFQSQYAESHLEARRPRWLAQRRGIAMDAFGRHGFPGRKNEQWRFTSLASFTRLAFEPAPVEGLEAAAAAAMEREGYADGTFHRAVFVNGRFAPGLSSLEGLADGVTIGSLRAAIESGEPLVEKHLARHAAQNNHHPENPFVALNTALHRDGAFVSVARGIAVEKPILLLFLASGATGPAIHHPRNLAVLGEGSRACVFESYAALDESTYCTNAVTEVAVGEGAALDHVRLQRESGEAFHFHTFETRLAANSRLTSHAAIFGARLSRGDVSVVLDGEGVDAALLGLYMIAGGQHADMHTHLDHARPHGHSIELYKGILDEESRGVFSGKILVRPGAQKTDAIQSNRGLLLTDTARLNSQPQLEIYADDVRCTHGASIGRMDENALFYARTRGLNLKAARRMLAFAFVNEVMGKIQADAARARIERLAWAWLDRHTPDE